MVADDGGVEPHLRQGAHFCLTLEAVEDRGALEGVTGVEPERATGLGALAPFSLQANLFSGFMLSLKDLFRVDRDKLAALDIQPLRELIGSGDMELVYAHLLSQENFLRLMNRRSFFATRAAA